MIDRAEVLRIARLARLSVTEEEAELYAGQLARILEHFRELDAVDAAGVEPTAHALGLVNALREDEPRAFPGAAELLAAAPASERGCFKVPKVIDVCSPPPGGGEQPLRGPSAAGRFPPPPAGEGESSGEGG